RPRVPGRVDRLAGRPRVRPHARGLRRRQPQGRTGGRPGRDPAHPRPLPRRGGVAAVRGHAGDRPRAGAQPGRGGATRLQPAAGPRPPRPLLPPRHHHAVRVERWHDDRARRAWPRRRAPARHPRRGDLDPPHHLGGRVSDRDRPGGAHRPSGPLAAEPDDPDGRDDPDGPPGSSALPVGHEDVVAAAGRIDGAVERTPSSHSRTLSDVLGCTVVVKFENLQFVASFKERGALNKLAQLDADERAAGVVAMSAGNHAQAVAYHATRLGIDATIVMPTSTPFVKVQRTRELGATVVLRGAGLAEAEREADRLVAEEGRTYVHPYDDPDVIAGQGTCALERLADH